MTTTTDRDRAIAVLAARTLISFLLLIAFAAACSDDEILPSSTITGTPAPPTLPPGGAPTPDPSATPYISAAGHAAIDIVDTDPFIVENFPGREITGAAIWDIDGEHTAMTVGVKLFPPIDIDLDLPDAYIGEFANDGHDRLTTPLPDPGYELRSNHITMSGVLGLQIVVDTTSGQIIEIIPLPFAP